MIQENLFAPQFSWALPNKLPDQLGSVIAVDTETYDPYLRQRGPGWAFADSGHVAGISLADNIGNVLYLPIGHEVGNKLPRNLVVNYLKDQLAGKKLIFANALYDLGWLKTLGIELLGNEIHDVQIMAPLIDENKPRYDLDSLAEEYLGEGKDYKLLQEISSTYGWKTKSQMMGNVWRLDAKYVRPYAEADARQTLGLYNRFLSIIEDQNLQQVYELERKLIPILFKMKERGVRIDISKAHRLKRDYESTERECLSRLRELVRCDIEIWSSASIARGLDYLGISYGYTDKGNPKLDSAFLETVDHEFTHTLLKARRYQKARSTFIENSILDKQENGRIHCNFNQLRGEFGGAAPGRFSSSSPNLQQIPARDPKIGKEIRSLFLPEEGEKWAALDFSAQEPRITVHYAVLTGSPGAKEAQDKYLNDPNTDYHQYVADICGIDRKTAKAINLGIAYGMGQKKLCAQLGLDFELGFNEFTGKQEEVPGQEARDIFKRYHQNAPFIKHLSDSVQKRAEHMGYIRTIMGRRCRFKKEYDGTYGFTYKALNRLVQGSAADMIKKAMIDVYEQHNTLPLLTVHDELDFSVKQEEQAQAFAKTMQNALTISVPNVVDIEIGDSWGDSMG